MRGAPKPKRIGVVRPGEIVQGPVVGCDAIYVGSRDDVTVRLDRQTLKPVWAVESDSTRVNRLIAEDLLAVGGPKGAGVRRTSDGHLLWRHEARFQGAPPWSQYLLITNQEIELHDPLTGAIMRSISVPGGLENPGTICEDLLILPVAQPCEKAIDLDSGMVAWERELRVEMSRYLAEPPHSRLLRVTRSSREGLFLAMHGGSTFGCSLKDGSVLWHVSHWSPADSSPTIHGGCLYILLHDRLLAIDEATGQIAYQATHPELEPSYREKTGTIYKGRLAIATESGHVAVFNLADGALVSLHADKLPLWRTAEADGRLLVATGDGKLLVFDEAVWGL